MKTLVKALFHFFAHLFVRIVYILFILSGIIAALTSGFLEAQVFNSIFEKSMNESPEMFYYIPLLVVFAMEATKVFLIFIHKQHTTRGNQEYIVHEKYFTYTRFLLIFISILSTLIFSFYNLHNPQYEHQKNTALQKLETEHRERIERRNREFQQEKNRRLKIDNKEVDRWKRLVDQERKRIVGRTWEGRDFLSYFTKQKAAMKVLNEHQNEIEEKRIKYIENLEKEYEEKKKEIKIDLSQSPESANKLIGAALLALNMNNNYQQWQYIFSIVFLSLLLSFALESIIWVVFTIISIHHGDIFDLDLDIYNKTGQDQIKQDYFRDNVLREKEQILKSADIAANNYKRSINNVL